MDDKQIKLFIVVPSMSTFIRKDIEIFQKHFDVRVHLYRGLKSLPLSLFMIFVGVLRSDVCYARFVDNHAFWTVIFSRLFRKKSIVVVGGYEVARIPGLKYGLNRSRFFPKVVRYVLSHADRILTVSNSLKEDAIINLGVNGNNIITVPNGFNSAVLHPRGEKEPSVLTVALCSKMEIARLKGIHTFIDTAKRLPDVKFIVIGLAPALIAEYCSKSPTNVTFIKPIPFEDLIGHFQKAKIYCQLSIREGHPNTICEAMLCECIPIGTDVPGIREVWGAVGYLVPVDSPNETAEAIKKAFTSNQGQKARQHITSHYSLQKREQTLISIVRSLI